MPSLHTVKHLALLKRRGRVLRAAKGAERGAFWLVRNRDTGEALLHVDLEADAAAWRNPVRIWRELRRLKPLGPKAYADFFADPRALVSCAGVVVGDASGSRLLFTRTVRTGKGRDLDLQLALKELRFLRGRIDTEGPDDDQADEAASVERDTRVKAVRDLFGDDAPTPERVLDGLYEHLGASTRCWARWRPSRRRAPCIRRTSRWRPWPTASRKRTCSWSAGTRSMASRGCRTASRPWRARSRRRMATRPSRS